MAVTWKKLAYFSDIGAGAGVDEVARDNIVLLAFKLAIQEGLSIFNLEDGFVDEFEDATGINAGDSTHESYSSTNDYYSPEASGTLDDFEYSTDALAQAAYVTNAAIASNYPPSQNDTYVKTTTKYSTDHWPYYATDPAKSVTGTAPGNGWISAYGSITNQRFHIDLGSAFIVNKIYYQNYHDSGLSQTSGVKNFTFWGSNSATSFAELTYGTDTGWTQLTTSQSTFDQHSVGDVSDPKYITVTNNTAYRYYAFKFANNWLAGGIVMGLRRIELQVYPLQFYSEPTTKSQGSYSLKGVATTNANGKTLTKTVSPAIDLSGIDSISLDIYSSRTGSNIKIGIHDSGGTTTELTPSISAANTWEVKSWDLSGVADANKNVIDQIIVTIVNADSANTFYIDNFLFGYENMTLISETVEAETEPTKARLILLVEPVDSITINTDLLGYVSNDGGSNYDAVTLVDEGSFDASKTIYSGNVTLTDRSDKTMVVKAVTANNKNLKIHGWALLWS